MRSPFYPLQRGSEVYTNAVSVVNLGSPTVPPARRSPVPIRVMVGKGGKEEHEHRTWAYIFLTHIFAFVKVVLGVLSRALKVKAVYHATVRLYGLQGESLAVDAHEHHVVDGFGEGRPLVPAC